jgi:hypothetical protein
MLTAFPQQRWLRERTCMLHLYVHFLYGYYNFRPIYICEKISFPANITYVGCVCIFLFLRVYAYNNNNDNPQDDLTQMNMS